MDIETWAETLRNEKLAAITQEAWVLRRQWVESLVARAKEEGMYRPEVDPRGLADLILAILAGLRVGKLLWRHEFDLERALGSLLLMHAGRLSNGTAVGLPQEEAGSGRGRRSG